MEQSSGAHNDALIGGVERVEIRLVGYDAAWPALFDQQAGYIRTALGEVALRIEHIGSTSVPDLPAKPIIDIVLAVPNSGDEGSYLPNLEQAEYQLRVREPEHRMFRTPTRDVHIHVYSIGCGEIERCLVFRNRLRASVEGRELYAQTKRDLAAQGWADMNAYAAAKTSVIEAVIARGKK